MKILLGVERDSGVAAGKERDVGILFYLFIFVFFKRESNARNIHSHNCYSFK